MNPSVTPALALCTPPPNIDLVLRLGVDSAQAQLLDRLVPEAWRAKWGGACAHMCQELSRCDYPHEVLPLFPVARATHGDRFIAWLRRLGIETAGIERHPGAIGTNLVLEFRDRTRKIIRLLPPTPVGPEHYTLELIRASAVLAINGSLDRAVLRAALAEADLAHVPICWNPSVAHFHALRRGLGRAVLLLQLNREEGRELADQAPDTPADAVAEQVRRITGARFVVITCGAEGACCALGEGRMVARPAPALAEAGPVTGLGDRHFALVTAALTHLGLGDPGAAHIEEALSRAASILTSPSYARAEV